MNLSYTLYVLNRKLRSAISLAYFKVIQKPLWLFSYNNGNTFKCDGKLFNCKINLTGNNNKLIIEKKVVLKNVHFEITGYSNTIIIKEGTVFGEGGRFRIEDANNKIEIGRDVAVSEAFIAASDFNTKITIGDNCLLSAKIIMRTSDGHSILDSDNKRINPGDDIEIGEHVWIGYGVTILKGSRIGENSIIGTEAIISGKPIPAGSIAVGIGKVVKSGVNWCKERLDE